MTYPSHCDQQASEKLYMNALSTNYQLIRKLLYLVTDITQFFGQ